MQDLAMERQHLTKADSDIAEGEERIARQVELMAGLRHKGHGAAEGERLLETLRQTLQSWRNHRETILRTIARLEGRDGVSDERAAPSD